MNNFSDTNINNLEQLLGRTFDPEEQHSIDLWNRGRALAQLRNFYGFEVLLAMLQDYAMNATNQLLSVDPKEHDEVRAAHAAAFAITRLLRIFVEDVDNAINASTQTPHAIVEAQKLVKTPGPAEAM